MSNTNKFTKTLQDLNNFVDSEIIKTKKFDDLRSLSKNKIQEFHDICLKTKEVLPDQVVTKFEESEIKKMTKNRLKIHSFSYKIQWKNWIVEIWN